MRELENINPALTADIIEKFGFHFDGYYNVKPGVIFKFRNDQDKGFVPVFDDPGLPPFDQGLQTYSDFISFLNQALQMQLISDEQRGMIKSDPRQYVAKLVHDWFGSDSDLKFIIIASPQGISVIPNDEYTFSIVNGSIHQFIIRYISNANDLTEKIECSPQCISWPFMVKYLRELNETEDITITSCKIIDGDEERPFFGIGIPKVKTK